MRRLFLCGMPNINHGIELRKKNISLTYCRWASSSSFRRPRHLLTEQQLLNPQTAEKGKVEFWTNSPHPDAMKVIERLWGEKVGAAA